MIPLLAFALLGQKKQPANLFDPGPNPSLMQHPTMNATSIVFVFGGSLWKVPREGGEAVRLTVGPEVSRPYFSPDGRSIAFSADYDGNVDVYVMPAEGGTPKRLTSHPAPDECQGWTPDGKSVLFSSSMLSNSDYPRLFTVPITGGFPSPLPLPSGYMGCYSPDGKRLAYVPHDKWELAWKRYRGGQTYPIWIADLATSRVKAVPRENTNDEQPAWVGNKIYYLSDPHGPVGLSSYDVSTGREREEIPGSGFDIKSATAGPGGIVYEKLGSIRIYNPESRASRTVPISIAGDFLEARTELKNAASLMDGVALSPSGSRVAVSARGYVFTAPAEKGSVRLLDDAPGVHRREPIWSPDGKTIAYFTDIKGDQKLALYDTATAKEKLIDLGGPPSFYRDSVWSPDSKKIAYTANLTALWYVDLETGKNVQVDQTPFLNPRLSVRLEWSPDSKWLTWSRGLDNHLGAIFLYSLDSAKRTQITDGFSDAQNPVFDLNGKYLYFTASTEVGQGSSWLDISSMNNANPRSSVYCAVLKADEPNPLQPESDEEKGVPEEKAPPAKPAMPPKPPAFGIDLDGLEQRIIALPLPLADYDSIEHGPADTLFALTSAPRPNSYSGAGLDSVLKFSFKDRKVTPFASGVFGMQVTPDGSKALLREAGTFAIVPTMAPAAPGQGTVNLSRLMVKIDPKVEWNAMYHEIWRDERLLFYSPTLNGINSVAIERRYEPFLKNIESREDLNYLFTDMLGELCVGHEFPGGGDLPRGPSVPGGLLGADFSFKNHRYQLMRIYDGERWNPTLYAPLAQPGIHAKVGEYILAINGKDLTESTDLFEALEGTAGQQVSLKIGPNADGSGSRTVVVVPTASEFGLRQRAWEEDNRRYVQKMTNDRAGYVHVPDTNVGGWVAFNRFYYAEVGRDGMVIDERFNHGGLINDFMVREMLKPMDGAFKPRYAGSWPTPGAAIYGPKVMLINEMSGSGGDMFPWLFRHEKVGPIIGKRTWGGLIAAFGFPTIDGGRINAPDDAFFDPATNKWDVENWGVSPDQDVELDPAQWRLGHDSQLDAAIAQLNKELAAYKPAPLHAPPYPDRTILNKRY